MGAPLIVSLEGLPGSGNTTTAELVADLEGITHVHECSKGVSFLDAVYADVERYKLETELNAVYARISGSLPRPACAVYLEHDHGIAAHGREYERDFDRGYLIRLCDA